MSAGIDNQVYTGARPWHGRGTEIAKGVSCVDAVRSDRVLGSRIVASPAMIGAPSGQFIDWPGHFAHVREVDDAIVGLGSGRYSIMQHVELARFADKIAGDLGLTFDIAGLLRGGSQFVLQAKIAEPVAIGRLPDGREDTVTGYLTLGTSHDGERPTEIGFATMRAECANMTAMAMAQTRSGKRGTRFWSLGHVGDQQRKLGLAAEALQAGIAGMSRFVDFARAAAETAMSVEQFDAFALDLLPDAENGANTRRANRRDQWASLFANGIGNDGSTAWHAYNAITEWGNYRQPARGQGSDTLQRIESSLYGEAASLAIEAESKLQQFVYRLDD